MFDARGYLLDVTHRIPTKRTFQDIIDILARYRYNEFFLFAEGTIDEEDAIDFGRLEAYCRMQGLSYARLTRADFDALLLQGETVYAATEASRSLAGRVETMRENMEQAESKGRLRHARRFLVTDFSDGSMWHPLAVSLPAIILGGNFASSGAKAAHMDLERELNVVLDAPIGGLLLKLGTLYLRGGALRDGASEYFNILAGDCGYSRHPGLTSVVLDDVSGVSRGVRIAAERWLDRTEWAREIVYMANLLDCACHRRDETRLRALRDEHGHVWKARFLPYGRVESLARLPRF